MGFNRSFWLATLATGLFFFALQITFPILPLFITDALGASESLIGLSILLPTLVGISFRLPAGSWSDRYGRRPLMFIGLVVFTAYLAVSAIAKTVEVFLFSRVLFGVGLAIFTTVVKAYVGDVVPPERRGEAFGINTSAFSLALIFGPITGEILKNEFGFTVAFGFGAVLGAIAALVILQLPKDPPQEKGENIWRKTQQAMSLTGTRAALLTALTGAGTFAIIFVYFPVFAEERNIAAQAPSVLSNITISIGFIIFALVGVVATPRYGRFSDHHGRSIPIIMGIIIVIPGIVMMALATNIWVIYASVGVISLGASGIRSMMDALVQDACPPELRGVGTALLFGFWDVGIGVQSQVFGMLIEAGGFDWVFALLIGIVLLVGLNAVFLSYRAASERKTTYKQPLTPLA